MMHEGIETVTKVFLTNENRTRWIHSIILPDFKKIYSTSFLKHSKKQKNHFQTSMKPVLIL
ncbi:mCG148397 [Mus musculus]|nr:mCG148397 [Mus musculus]